jgi:pimeloyl-ACP methyl ester carboxylesterase
VSEWQHKFAKTNGIRMHYVEQGIGFPVLMMHGFPEMWYSWRFQVPALAKAGFRAIAPDMRGYGDTEVPEEEIVQPLPDIRSLRSERQMF